MMTLVVILDLPMKPQAAALSTTMTLPTELLQRLKSGKMLYQCHFYVFPKQVNFL